MGTTRFIRYAAVGLTVLILAVAILSAVASFIVQASARQSSADTAPGLVGLQGVLGSVAEANATATAAHLTSELTGESDRLNRSRFTIALDRAHEQLAATAAELGDDYGDANDEAVVDELQQVGTDLAEYGTLIEASQVKSLADLGGAESDLRSAFGVAAERLGPSIESLRTTELGRFNNESNAGSLLIRVVAVVAVMTLLAMIFVQYRLAQMTRRMFNPALVLASLLMLTVVGFLLRSEVARYDHLASANEGGFNAVLTTAEVQGSVFDLQVQLGLGLLSGEVDSSSTEALRAEIAQGIEALANDADSERELAAVQELSTRYARYDTSVGELIQAIQSGQDANAVAIYQGSGLSTFNGTNVSIESVLAENSDQFINGVESAKNAYEFTPWVTLLLSLLAAVLCVVGLVQRLGDFR